jgi:hypothetical protein
MADKGTDFDARPGIPFMVAGIQKWQAARAALAEMERAERPDVTDGYGRTWQWFGRADTYAHDGLLAHSLDEIPHLGLPGPALADNPNYDGLCGICRTRWTEAPQTCRADCDAPVPQPLYLMCERHWQRVPLRLRKACMAAYRQGQDVKGNASPEWAAATAAAIAAANAEA